MCYGNGMLLEASLSIPSSEQEQIRELGRILQLGTPALVGADGERICLPASVYEVLKEVVYNMQQGNAISLFPEQQQLTTQSAANLLGVSRPHFVKLLEMKKIPYYFVGNHRRVYLKDVLAYAKQRDAERHIALKYLAKEAEEAGMYEGIPIPEGGSDE